MGWMTRRRFLALSAGSLAALAGSRIALPRWLALGGGTLSPAAAAFAERCFSGLDRSRVWDGHVHLVGIGSGGTGASVDPRMFSHRHPVLRFQFDVYAAAAGMSSPATADADYVGRLLALHRAANPEGKLLLLAFDRFVDEGGRERPDLSPIHTPTDYALGLARVHPDLVAAASIHPYRPDAVHRLDRAVDAGARAVKWIPNAMGMDPASPRCDALYRRLAERGIPLVCHAGKEHAVASDVQALGNPLRLRRALDHGVRVIVAHCGALGSFEDVDARESERRTMPSFDLFLRLFGERQYASSLFADLSALTQVNYSIRPLLELLAARELHSRLVYGSDYPLPAIRAMTSLRRLEYHGLLSGDERRMCQEVRAANPLLGNFVTMRSMRLETSSATHRFAPAVFETAGLFGAGGREPAPLVL